MTIDIIIHSLHQNDIHVIAKMYYDIHKCWFPIMLKESGEMV